MKSKVKEKRERAVGIKLFIKAERCNSPKCALIRKPQRPGFHGAKRRRLSEYGRQLQETQKIKLIYGLRNKQLADFFKKYPKHKIISLLEQRLDRTVLHLGFAQSSRIARQLVAHGHILVNEKKVTIPSYRIKKGDSIEVRPESHKRSYFQDREEELKKHAPPPWLERKEAFRGVCVASPEVDAHNFAFDIDTAGEFYAR